jgi:two-component system LytT family response regulator
MFKAILIDDEVHCLDTLNILIADYCQEIQVLELCVSAKKGLAAIQKYFPDLVFLDIEMPQMNGFELLEQLNEIPFSVIFTTSYDQYAIKAIRFSALDYLLKPVDKDELQKAVKKALDATEHPLPQQLEVLLQKLNHPKVAVNKIAIPTIEGLQMVLVENIIRCEADRNYTNLFLKNKGKITASRNLKDLEEMLEDYSFVRVHHSHLVNLNEVEKYIRGEGGYLLMSDKSMVDVSRSRKEILLKKLQSDKV